MKQTAAQNYKNIVIGVTLCAILSLAAQYASNTLNMIGVSSAALVLIMALVLSPLKPFQSFTDGYHFSYTKLLPIGVALLGFNIELSDLATLGWQAIIAVLTLVLLTFFASKFCAILLTKDRDFSILSAGATAICGTSAAVAIFACMDKGKKDDCNTLPLVIVGVTLLSSIAMVVTPIICKALGLDNVTAGFILGGSIHNVPQAIAAGYGFSDSAGDTAVLVKLARVACLIPLLIYVRHTCFRENDKGGTALPRIPIFLIGFIACAALNNLADFGIIAERARQAAAFLLIVAIAGIGLDTKIGSLFKGCIRPFTALALQAVLITFIAAGLIQLI